MFNKKVNLEQEIKTAISEIDKLMKSMQPMQKDGDQPDELKQQADEAAESAASEDQNEAPGQEPSPEGEQAPEGEDEGMAELQEIISQMSEEELQHLAALVQEILESKKAPAPEGQPAPAPEGQPAPAPAPNEFEKSLKGDLAALTKSMQAIAVTVESLSKEIKEVKKAPKSPIVTSKPVAMNVKGYEVLEKSTSGESGKKQERLNKSETIEFLMGKIGKGEKYITSDTIATVNAIREEKELHAFQDALTKKGVQFPKL
jgi:hypothetical protein